MDPYNNDVPETPTPKLSALRDVAVVSYRLGGTDGVSIEAAKWVRAFQDLGASVRTIAGSGVADCLVEGLDAGAVEPVDEGSLAAAIDGADVVLVENCCSLQLNRSAGETLARLLAGRPAILRHHDLPWQRPQFAGSPPPPDDEHWWHITINERSRIELAARGIRAVTFYNCFDPDPKPGDAGRARRAIGVGDGERLVLQPTRALQRKNIAGGIVFARALEATYWLLGPDEDGYGPDLERLVARAGIRVIQGRYEGFEIADAYAACDMVVLPSTFEGFGNPSIESAVHRRPLAIGTYPVASELRRFGFSWFQVGEPAPAARYLADPDINVLDRNQLVARMRFSTRDLPMRIGQVVTSG